MSLCVYADFCTRQRVPTVLLFSFHPVLSFTLFQSWLINHALLRDRTSECNSLHCSPSTTQSRVLTTTCVCGSRSRSGREKLWISLIFLPIFNYLRMSSHKRGYISQHLLPKSLLCLFYSLLFCFFVFSHICWWLAVCVCSDSRQSTLIPLHHLPGGDSWLGAVSQLVFWSTALGRGMGHLHVPLHMLHLSFPLSAGTAVDGWTDRLPSPSPPTYITWVGTHVHTELCRYVPSSLIHLTHTQTDVLFLFHTHTSTHNFLAGWRPCFKGLIRVEGTLVCRQPFWEITHKPNGSEVQQPTLQSGISNTNQTWGRKFEFNWSDVEEPSAHWLAGHRRDQSPPGWQTRSAY